MPNTIAHLVLLGWVPVSLALFMAYRPLEAATITLLGACLLLPANFAISFQGIPEIDRHVVGGLAVVLGYYLFGRTRPSMRLQMDWPLALVLIHVFCVVVTMANNPDPLQYGPIYLPGLTNYDALGAIFRRFLTIGVPFLLGRRLMRADPDVWGVIRLIVLFGLAYIPIVFWEARMSPQLHTDLYGYFPHSFAQQIRAGGYRPVGFTSHGLELALFMATATIAALGMVKASRGQQRNRAMFAFAALTVAVLFCRSLGPLLHVVLGVTLLGLRRSQSRAIVAIAAIVVFYPFLRANDLFPTEVAVSTAQWIDEDRAESLEFRLENEDLLLAKARERSMFGWGIWGRNRVYDAQTGRDASVTDGYWVLEIGMFGLVGFLSLFGLLLLPVVSACRQLPRMKGSDRLAIATLSVLVLVRALDLLPNAFPAPLTFFLAGCLLPFGARGRR